jgi:hypothetical protein
MKEGLLSSSGNGVMNGKSVTQYQISAFFILNEGMGSKSPFRAAAGVHRPVNSGAILSHMKDVHAPSFR